MEFEGQLTEAILLKRVKRFLAEVVVTKADQRTLYCPNTGDMHGCSTMGSRVWFSTSPNTRRKYRDTWELIENEYGHLVSINTHISNTLVKEAIENGTIHELQGYSEIETEAPFGEGSTRIDIRLEKETLEDKNNPLSNRCYVEVKAVTLGDEIHRGFYPDMPVDKEYKRLKLLKKMCESGVRVVMLYCVQHTGIDHIFPADHIDKAYGKALREAIKAGLEVYAYRCDISLEGISIKEPIEVNIPARDYQEQIR